METKFFLQSELQTINLVRKFFVQKDRNYQLFIKSLFDVWGIEEEKINFIPENNDISNVLKILKTLKTKIDNKYKNYNNNKFDDYSWALTIYKIAMPRLFIKTHLKEKNIAKYPLEIILHAHNEQNNTKRMPQTVNIQIKKIVENLTVQAFEQISNTAFYEEKTNNPFVKEISEKLNKKIQEMTTEETFKQISNKM